MAQCPAAGDSSRRGGGFEGQRWGGVRSAGMATLRCCPHLLQPLTQFPWGCSMARSSLRVLAIAAWGSGTASCCGQPCLNKGDLCGRASGAMPVRGGGEVTHGVVLGDAGRCQGHRHSVSAVGTTSQGWTGDPTREVTSCWAKSGEWHQRSPASPSPTPLPPAGTAEPHGWSQTPTSIIAHVQASSAYV